MAKTWAERVAESNAEFAAMTDAAKRVAVAQDVLDALDAKKLIPQSGHWAGIYSGRMVIDNDTDLRDVIQESVCGVLRADAIQVGEMYGTANTPSLRDVFTYLEHFFSLKQLKMIEVAFECGSGYVKPASADSGRDYLDRAAYDSAVHFTYDHTGYFRAEKRLRMIMENIVENHGEFVPDATPRLLDAPVVP